MFSGKCFLCGIAFLCYEGYWLFGAVILTLAALSRWRTKKDMVTYTLMAFGGLLAAIAITGIVAKVFGHDLFRLLIEFSGSSSGEVGQAWRLVGEYFWDSEHFLSVFWAVAVLFAIALLLIGRAEARAAWSLAGAALFYAGIVMYSDVTGRFALFARHCRPLAIFLCLIAAWFLAKLFKSGVRGKVFCFFLLAGILAQAGWNMRIPITQEFPYEFKKQAHSIILEDMRKNFGPYQIWSDGYYEDEKAMESRPFRVLYQSPHPIQFLPYIFDGWNAELRSAFRSQDQPMRVVRLLPEMPDRLPQITRNGGSWSPFLGACAAQSGLQDRAFKIGSSQ